MSDVGQTPQLIWNLRDDGGESEDFDAIYLDTAAARIDKLLEIFRGMMTESEDKLYKSWVSGISVYVQNETPELLAIYSSFVTYLVRLRNSPTMSDEHKAQVLQQLAAHVAGFKAEGMSGVIPATAVAASTDTDVLRNLTALNTNVNGLTKTLIESIVSRYDEANLNYGGLVKDVQKSIDIINAFLQSLGLPPITGRKTVSAVVASAHQLIRDRVEQGDSALRTRLEQVQSQNKEEIDSYISRIQMLNTSFKQASADQLTYLLSVASTHADDSGDLITQLQELLRRLQSPT